MTTQAAPIEKYWKVEHYHGHQLSIVPRDGKERVANLCHSGFGASVEDRPLAEHIVKLHNEQLFMRTGWDDGQS